jgi:hypothetical protein
MWKFTLLIAALVATGCKAPSSRTSTLSADPVPSAAMPVLTQTMICEGDGFKVEVFAQDMAHVNGRLQLTLYKQQRTDGILRYVSADGDDSDLVIVDGKGTLIHGAIAGKLRCTATASGHDSSTSEAWSWDGGSPVNPDWSMYNCNGNSGQPRIGLNLVDYGVFVVDRMAFQTDPYKMAEGLKAMLAVADSEVEATVDFREHASLAALERVAVRGRISALNVTMAGKTADGQTVTVHTIASQAKDARFQLAIEIGGRLVEKRAACWPDYQGFWRP